MMLSVLLGSGTVCLLNELCIDVWLRITLTRPQPLSRVGGARQF